MTLMNLMGQVHEAASSCSKPASCLHTMNVRMRLLAAIVVIVFSFGMSSARAADTTRVDDKNKSARLFVIARAPDLEVRLMVLGIGVVLIGGLTYLLNELRRRADKQAGLG